MDVLEPVAAYDRVAPEYARLSAARRKYLEQVERLIARQIPSGKCSLLDVGSGDGTRSARIAAACGIERLVFLEPSAGMRACGVSGRETWTIRAEELESVQVEFDVIVCLWNVLGHIATADNRQAVLRQFVRLLAPNGLVFLDVNHRYNALQYGFAMTAARWLKDLICPSENNGDVVARWDLGEIQCATHGHVFTDSEIRSLAQGAGLTITDKFVIDYSSGQICRCHLFGNLLYCMRKESERSGFLAE